MRVLFSYSANSKGGVNEGNLLSIQFLNTISHHHQTAPHPTQPNPTQPRHPPPQPHPKKRPITTVGSRCPILQSTRSWVRGPRWCSRARGCCPLARRSRASGGGGEPIVGWSRGGGGWGVLPFRWLGGWAVRGVCSGGWAVAGG